MSELTFKQFYNNLLDENIEFLNLSDPIIMDEFTQYVKSKYNEYKELNKPGSVENIYSTEYFSQLQEKYIKGFNVECLMSLIPARIYYFQTISLIFKKSLLENTWENKNYIIKSNNNNDRIVSPLIHFFWQQETSSGKSKGHRYFLEICTGLSKHIAQLEKLKTGNKYNIEKTKWTETQETFINYFQQTMTSKGIQFDFNAPPIKGIFETADILASEECAFLFNENRSDKQNISELLLDSLEGNIISKTLVSWKGNKTLTKPNFLFSGLSRPTENITKDFFNKGLFQRMIIYTRSTSQNSRITALEKSFYSNKCNKNYYDMLVKDFYDLYDWKEKVKPMVLRYENENEIKKLILTNVTKIFNELNIDYKHNKTIRDGISPFISRYYGNVIYQLMTLSCLSRKSVLISTKDFKEANYIIQKSIESIKLFCEMKIKISPYSNKKENDVKKYIDSYAIKEQNKPFTFNDLSIFINNKTRYPLLTINSIINEFISIGYLISKNDKLSINKNEYNLLSDEINSIIKDKNISKKLWRKK